MYQGRLDVAASGPALYDFEAREMSPGLGAFTSNDTVLGSATNPRQLNRYVYAKANPRSFIDPDGHCSFALDADDPCEGTAGWSSVSYDQFIEQQRQQAEITREDGRSGYLAGTTPTSVADTTTPVHWAEAGGDTSQVWCANGQCGVTPDRTCIITGSCSWMTDNAPPDPSWGSLLWSVSDSATVAQGGLTVLAAAQPETFPLAAPLAVVAGGVSMIASAGAAIADCQSNIAEEACHHSVARAAGRWFIPVGIRIAQGVVTRVRTDPDPLAEQPRTPDGRFADKPTVGDRNADDLDGVQGLFDIWDAIQTLVSGVH